MEYKDIEKVNAEIKTVDIKGNPYAEVPQRVQAFRKLYPEGQIITNLLKAEDGICYFEAIVCNDEGTVLAKGHAYEKEDSTFINKTSYIENCETSAVGRALGFLGIGSCTSIASAEEVQTAIANQGERYASPKQVEYLKKIYTGEKLETLLEKNGIKTLEELPMWKASELISKLRGGK